MKRTISTVKTYDYTSMKEFEKHCIEMSSKGYCLIKDDGSLIGNAFSHGEIVNDEKYVYSASFVKSTL